jgi:phenylacetate-coenzyme A ligase PaaK-like adenylate-forming protein
MSLKSFAAKIYANWSRRQIDKWANKPIETQKKVFQSLISAAKQTSFGKDHNFEAINSFKDFAKQVPIRDYEALKPYVDRVVEGESNVLWPGKPLYFAKTSGTTSGAKYIPLTKDSMPTHIAAARNAILCYIAETGKSSFVDGKMIFLQGSPVLDEKNGIKLGRLSGIVAHFIPSYLQKNRLPSWEVNCIDDWETKVNAIVKETIDQDMTIISGIPSWVQTYFEKLVDASGKPIGKLFKNLELFIYGGLNYEPYRPKFEQLVGRSINSIELYPASEGFFAFQDKQDDNGMLLQLDSGMFYEFIKSEEFFEDDPKIYSLEDVEIGQNYVLIISTNAGLWRYNIGDTIQFTSLKPFKVRVSGRIKHFISAFGEHVIGSEVEKAMEKACAEHQCSINEFTVAPQVNPEAGLPYHEWWIEFNNAPQNIEAFSNTVDDSLVNQNSYYKDLRDGNMLREVVIRSLPENSFNTYMKSIGKLGGQNKIPRLSDDRKIADKLEQYLKS